MKFMIPFLIAILPVAAVAQSQSRVASGVPKVAIPKITGVKVIQTARHGVTPQQIIAVMPSEIVCCPLSMTRASTYINVWIQ